MSDENGNQDTPSAVLADPVQSLERELGGRTRRLWLRRLAVGLGASGLIAGAYAYHDATRPAPPARYVTAKVEKRDIVEEIQSTGKVKPLTEVQVGAQVSGRIVKVHADFNSRVKKGDLLAEIDPSLFGAQVDQTRAQIDAARANMERARANVASSQSNFRRLESLSRERLTTEAEVDQARGTHEVAQAEVGAARAQLEQLQAQLSSASTTLKYTKIYSPIDGLVINRTVEPGQTVASSFSAPVLFVIAQDLSKMQVLADIDEADVGKVRESMAADVLVDAFPRDKFKGKVTQVRFSPTEVQGVVTYAAVIEVSNPEFKLRPGMTATVTIPATRASGVTAVPNAALRFRPVSQSGPEGREPEAPPVALPSSDLKPGQQRLYLMDGDPNGERLSERTVEVGITDGSWTEARGGIAIGADVVTEQRDKQKRPKFLGLF